MGCAIRRDSLLLKWFKIFPGCIRKGGGASGSIFQRALLFMVCNFNHGRLSNCTQNVRFGVSKYNVIMGNGMLCYKARHPMPMKCFIPFPTCIHNEEGASDSLYKSLIVHMVSFLSRVTLKLHTKYHIWGALSAHDMRCHMPCYKK